MIRHFDFVALTSNNKSPTRQSCGLRESNGMYGSYISLLVVLLRMPWHHLTRTLNGWAFVGTESVTIDISKSVCGFTSHIPGAATGSGPDSTAPAPVCIADSPRLFSSGAVPRTRPVVAFVWNCCTWNA